MATTTFGGERGEELGALGFKGLGAGGVGGVFGDEAGVVDLAAEAGGVGEIDVSEGVEHSSDEQAEGLAGGEAEPEGEQGEPEVIAAFPEEPAVMRSGYGVGQRRGG